jgi:NAD(P)H-hydrate epimerase
MGALVIIAKHELLTNAEMGRADRLAVAAGVPSLTLMENAGRAVAQAVAQLSSAGDRIGVVCGPGNNGGDGFVAARLLRAAGSRVRLALLGARERLRGDAAEMARQWGEAIEPLTPASIADADLIIDALFGAGLTRPLDGVAAEVVAAINAHRRTVVAVDVPSGLEGDTGRSEGPVVQADCTVTFLRLKPGHLLLPGRSLCGQVRLADIGIPETVLQEVQPRAFANRPSLWGQAFPRPRTDAHKYTRGHALVVSGPADSTGAARLAARGALRSGAGLVTLLGSAAATAVNATHMTAVMVKALADDAALAALLTDVRRNAALIGPGAGVGAVTAGSVLTLLAAAPAVVLDADALTAFAASDDASVPATGFGFVLRGADPAPTRERLFAIIKARSAPVVITPHEGEFLRLFGALAGSKLARARSAATTSGAVVILKGPDTVIAAADGQAAINDNAPPWLATAGAGDVLAGMVTGLLAQGMPPFAAACAGVWLHGECARSFGPGLIAEDLPEALPPVLAQLLA